MRRLLVGPAAIIALACLMWVISNIDHWIGKPAMSLNRAFLATEFVGCQALPNPNLDRSIDEPLSTDVVFVPGTWAARPVETDKLREDIQAYRKLADARQPTLPGQINSYLIGGPFTCIVIDNFNWEREGGNLPFAQFDASVLRGSIFGSREHKRDLSTKNYEGASFRETELNDASFVGTSLRNANFSASILDGADFSGADLTGANFEFASVAGVIFQPRAGAASESLASARGLEDMAHYGDVVGLLQLREVLRRAGRRDLERAVTYAIEKGKTLNLYWSKDYLSAATRYIAWHLPTAYDLHPDRALIILAGSIVLFALPYALALSKQNDPKIWRVLAADRLHGDGTQTFEALRVSRVMVAPFALLFSVSSAFQLSWRDLNVGSWLTRLQGTEYALRGSGWVRTVSGVQSLLSVYLLAMWVLTQFGRLFEG